MTKRVSRLIFFIIAFFIFISPGQAQTGSVSPYSRYGIGDILQEGFSMQNGMNGTGAAVAHPFNINYINPATYSFDTVTVFEFGARGEYSKIESEQTSNTYNSASFAYLSLAFPVIKDRMSLAFGLLPYSSVGYDISVTENVTNVGDVTYKYQGSGGFNKFFIGTGIRINRNFSAGINASYLFGTIQNKKSIEFEQRTNFFNTRYINSVSANDFYFNYGIHYKSDLKNEYRIMAGITGALSADVKAINNQYYFNYIISDFGGEIIKDSVIAETRRDGNIRLPQNLRAGLVIAKGTKWMAGADFTYQNWSEFRNFELTDSLDNSYSIHAGGEYRTEKLIYRAGGRFNRTYLNLRNTELNDYSITLGIGLIKMFSKRPPSTINLAVELGQKGTTENKLVKENYIRVHLGITLADIWFIKPRYD
jgi:long-subunit fatty acid transport protein